MITRIWSIRAWRDGAGIAVILRGEDAEGLQGFFGGDAYRGAREDGLAEVLNDVLVDFVLRRE